MVQVYSKALNQSIEINRILGHIKGDKPGPAVIFSAGIHGNEPAGVFALHQFFNEIKEKNIPVKGNVYGIGGNLSALEKGERYNNQDLNRLWTMEKMEKLQNGGYGIMDEDKHQQVEIFQTIRDILEKETGPCYFMDLHTTSSETIPFLTVNDSLDNRKFTEQYPLPIILGIEEYLDGPLLSYINELGYVAFGFEGGQHQALTSIENHKAFLYLTLVFSGNIERDDIDFGQYYQKLNNATRDLRAFYEIFEHYHIEEGERFSMKNGFVNFQKIRKNQELATSNGGTVLAPKTGRIFMPLYQAKGHDGFFTVRKIPLFFLRVSAFLRKLRFDLLLPILPGVYWLSKKHDTLIVNKKIARFFTKQFLHLLGYRSKKLTRDKLIVKNRDAAGRARARSMES